MEKTNWLNKLGKRYNKRAEELNNAFIMEGTFRA